MDYTIWLQSLLELALSVSGEQEPQALYRKASRAFLRKLDGTAFLILTSTGEIDFSAPKRALSPEAIKAFLKESEGHFPSTLGHQGQYVYIYALRTEGFLLFMRAIELPEAVVRELEPIVSRLAVSLMGAKATQNMKHIEQTLREERTFLRMVIDNIPDMIFYKDKAGIYKLVNNATADALGYKVEDMIGKSDFELHDSAEAKWYTALDHKATLQEETLSCEGEYYDKNGEKRYVETALTPFHMASNKAGVIGIARDVTKRKAVQALMDRRMAFQRVLMHLALSFINVELSALDSAIHEALESAGRFVGADRAYVFEYLFDEGLMNNTYEWCGEGVLPAIDMLQNVPIEPFVEGFIEKHLLGEVVNVPDVFALETTDPLYEVLSMQDIKSMIGIPLMLSKRCIGFIGFDAVFEKRTFGEDETALLKVLSEIFSNAMGRKTHEKALIEAKHMAEAANRAKSSFLANMSHEIRTPLNGIVGMMYLLKDTEIHQLQKEYIQIIDDSTDALLSIINNILDFSKIEAGQLKLEHAPFDFEEEVFKVCGMIKGRAKEGVELIVDYGEQCPKRFLGDKVRIRQVLINLVGNAVKFTHEGAIVIKVAYEGGCLVFTVSDTGVGISEKAQSEVFEQFTQEDDSSTKRYEGTGLGLAITKQLVELMGGHIGLKSTLGVGSTFTVIVPMIHEAVQVAPKIDYKLLKGKRALIVDDHPVNRKILMAYLSEWHVAYDSANTGVDAILDIEMSIKSEKPYDFVLLDLAMPEMDGLTLSKIMSTRPEWQGMKKLLLSSLVGTFKENDYTEYGFDAVLSKPFAKTELFEVLVSLYQEKVVEVVEIKEAKGLQVAGLKLLIVDDNAVNRMAVRHMMTKWGYEVFEASSGEEAIERAIEMTLDMVLMDIHMPGMDGYETTRAIRAHKGPNQNVPIVAISANALEQDREKSFASGMNGHIGKPFKIEDLLSLQEKYMGGSLKTKPKGYVFDESNFVNQFDNDLDLACDVLAVYHSDFSRFVEKMIIAYKREDCKGIKDLAHELKGASAYVSANRIVSLCIDIMTSCEAKSQEEIWLQIQDLKNEGELFIETSRYWLEIGGEDI